MYLPCYVFTADTATPPPSTVAVSSVISCFMTQFVASLYRTTLTLLELLALLVNGLVSLASPFLPSIPVTRMQVAVIKDES